MSQTLKLPNTAQAASQLTRLLRRQVEVTAISAPAKGQLTMGGFYRAADGALLGACMADLAFAAHSGAAFALIPAEAASDAVRRRALDDNLRENFAEVLNVASRLFIAPQDVRVTLREMHLPPQASAPEVLAAATGAVWRVDIDGYGEGVLALGLA